MPHTENLPLLLLLQSSCFTITLTLAVVLLMSRWHLRSSSRAYETSRWLLIAALTLYVIHYLLQMLFGFRARGEDVGALVNILFYMPAALLLACATLRISTGQRYLRRFVTWSTVGMGLNYVLFVVGICLYGSIHMPWILEAMEVIYVALIAFMIFNPNGELRRMNRKIEEETADDQTPYRLYMRSGTILLYAMGFIGALSIFSTLTVVCVALFFLLALIFYVVSFVSLGYGIQSVSSVVDDDNQTTQAEGADAAAAESEQVNATQHLSPELVDQIRTAIAQWRQAKGYGSQNLTIVSMAELLGVSKRQFTQYLLEHEGSTFRVWLSNIRIEEAKRMLLTEADYSIESIAELCGFSSLSWMREKFKVSTGMTPAEWREAKRNEQIAAISI